MTLNTQKSWVRALEKLKNYQLKFCRFYINKTAFILQLIVNACAGYSNAIMQNLHDLLHIHIFQMRTSQTIYFTVSFWHFISFFSFFWLSEFLKINLIIVLLHHFLTWLPFFSSFRLTIHNLRIHCFFSFFLTLQMICNTNSYH